MDYAEVLPALSSRGARFAVAGGFACLAHGVVRVTLDLDLLIDSLGVEARLVKVEVGTNCGLPQTTIVGLPDAAVRESRERVQAAIRNCGLHLEPRAVVINLLPADLRKEGNHSTRDDLNFVRRGTRRVTRSRIRRRHAHPELVCCTRQLLTCKTAVPQQANAARIDLASRYQGCHLREETTSRRIPASAFTNLRK